MRTAQRKLTCQEGLVVAVLLALCVGTGLLMVHDIRGNALSAAEIIELLRWAIGR